MSLGKLIFSSIEFGTPEYDQSVRLRDEILRRPLGLEFHAEDLAKEWEQYHIAGFDIDARIQAVLVLLPISENTLKMRQVAVAADQQTKGYGRELVIFTEEWAKKRGFSRIELSARQVVEEFYHKLDYKTKGKVFEEVNIPHVKMWKEL